MIRCARNKYFRSISFIDRASFGTSAVTSTTKVAVPISHPQQAKAVKLTNRRLISVHGQDSTNFLQGITTNTVKTGQRSGQYSAFLTAQVGRRLTLVLSTPYDYLHLLDQGRVLNDVFIYPSTHSSAYTDKLPQSLSQTDPAYLIEVDATEALKLYTHIKRYRLRAKVSITILDKEEWSAWSLWDERDNNDLQESFETEQGRIGCADLRAPGMGQRLILPGSENPADFAHNSQDSSTVSLEVYTIRRMLKGVPEGQSEILRETALPQESNIDYMGGIDFRKGCYVGQELTIRIHHTGVVRKRILPVRLYEAEDETEPEGMAYNGSTTVSLPPPGTNIFRIGDEKKRSAGKWLQGVGNIGLTLCRLEVMTDTKLPAGRLAWKPEDRFMAEWLTESGRLDGKVKVKAFVPTWHLSRSQK